MKSSCLDFINSIGYENFKMIVSDYFDHVMAFYRLCGTCAFETISTNVTDSIVTFHIIFANKNDAETLLNISQSNMERRLMIFKSWFNYDIKPIDKRTVEVQIYQGAI